VPRESLEDSAEGIEHFAPTTGRITGVLGVLLAAAVLVAGVVRPGDVAAPVMAAAALGGTLAWAALLRPRVSVSPSTLYLRNMVETIEVPLPAVEELAIRQVLAVRVGEKRYVCPGLGRKLRKMVKKPRTGSMFLPDIPETIDDGERSSSTHTAKQMKSVDYIDHVETRLRHLIGEARGTAATAEVRRVPAWPEIAALAASSAALLVTVLL
jgi:hypothetical protein